MEKEMVHRFEHRAMATPWMVSIASEDANAAADAAREAFALVDRIEEDLSRFQAMSYVGQLGRLKAGESLGVSPATFECLQLGKAVWEATSGAFDMTVRREPQEGWYSQMEHIVLCDRMIVQVTEDQVAIDLGGIGKGFAIDEITGLFLEHEVKNAFIDAGGSTHYGIGTLPGESEGWPASLGDQGVIALDGQALSASGFEMQGYHVIDPRTGAPVETTRGRSWVMAGSAALADALSTAALIMTEEELGSFSEAHPDITIMLS
ncbi:MAG: thiamine biosynthesis lipoprotein [Verrucomicrobiales bacterium]|jgi:thiamine biosynthesis lipoprotein